jgi:hypothetical protein
MIPYCLVSGLSLALIALSLQGCAAQTYSAKPITATVVDAETGEPVVGANVVAHWVLHYRESWARAGDLELLETVTDNVGKFHFSGWEGKVPPSDQPYQTRLGNADPMMILFKSGYKPGSAVNYLQPERLREENHTWQRYSDWDGEVIKLERVKGNLQTYASAVEGITTGLGSGIKCAWKRTPKFYASLMKERQRLDGSGIRNFLPTLQRMELNFKNSGCGSARGFFEEYLK